MQNSVKYLISSITEDLTETNIFMVSPPSKQDNHCIFYCLRLLYEVLPDLRYGKVKKLRINSSLVIFVRLNDLISDVSVCIPLSSYHYASKLSVLLCDYGDNIDTT